MSQSVLHHWHKFRAIRKSDGLEVVLKIQYPGVAEAIDSDMNLLKTC
jgi:predicted unusual protein kinase regulating ubiquinone biosynthesis (AarF/ABC1/UbiB family)